MIPLNTTFLTSACADLGLSFAIASYNRLCISSADATSSGAA